MTKRCTSCLIEKPLDEFHRVNRATGQRTPRRGFGVAAICKACQSHQRKPTLAAERQRLTELQTAGLKACNVCGHVKPRERFAIRRASIDGLCMTCKECAAERCKRWRESHPGAYGSWYQKNREYKAEQFSKWRGANKELIRDLFRRWAKANPGAIGALSAKRNARKLNATPAWVDMKAIKIFYDRATTLSRETGIERHVDHIVPLQGKLVCGLHVAHNLQVLTRTENISKKNRFMPHFHTARVLSPSD